MVPKLSIKLRSLFSDNTKKKLNKTVSTNKQMGVKYSREHYSIRQVEAALGPKQSTKKEDRKMWDIMTRCRGYLQL